MVPLDAFPFNISKKGNRGASYNNLIDREIEL